MTDFSGGAGSIWNGEVVAGNEQIQAQLLKALKQVG
jgi:myo-inositol-1(or 4)-monophosphatase